jgi:hypothetical protein
LYYELYNASQSTLFKRCRQHATHDVFIGVNGITSLVATLLPGKTDKIVTAGVYSSEKECINNYAIIQSLTTIGYDAGMLLAQEIKHYPAPSTRILVQGQLFHTSINGEVSTNNLNSERSQ